MRKGSYVNVVPNDNSVGETFGGNNVDVEVLAPKSVKNVDDLSVVNSNLHPLYLQNIDHPGLVLNSKKLTGTKNYDPWKRSLTIAFSAKNKVSLINGTCSKADETT